MYVFLCVLVIGAGAFPLMLEAPLACSTKTSRGDIVCVSQATIPPTIIIIAVIVAVAITCRLLSGCIFGSGSSNISYAVWCVMVSVVSCCSHERRVRHGGVCSVVPNGARVGALLKECNIFINVVDLFGEGEDGVPAFRALATDGALCLEGAACVA